MKLVNRCLMTSNLGCLGEGHLHESGLSK
ncbi:hypothetical protein SPV_2464 [Streptococcus pneumoniae]|nr:hypothetical protein SPV_2464 [Streptococcus pneumoniae]